MPSIFKIWLEIEEIDHEEDTYESAAEPLPVAEFLTVEEAEAFRDKIVEVLQATNNMPPEPL